MEHNLNDSDTGIHEYGADHPDPGSATAGQWIPGSYSSDARARAALGVNRSFDRLNNKHSGIDGTE